MKNNKLMKAKHIAPWLKSSISRTMMAMLNLAKVWLLDNVTGTLRAAELQRREHLTSVNLAGLAALTPIPPHSSLHPILGLECNMGLPGLPLKAMCFAVNRMTFARRSL